tara:strand:+ start:1973 stop:2329 length:357 start_codon:yes stop_codon:yes gene_type:complete
VSNESPNHYGPRSGDGWYDDLLTDQQATQILRILDALDELEAASLKMIRAELECGPVLDGLIADPLTEGTRLDLICVVDTLTVDLLKAMGRSDSVRRLVEGAPPGSARDALAKHLACS